MGDGAGNVACVSILCYDISGGYGSALVSENGELYIICNSWKNKLSLTGDYLFLNRFFVIDIQIFGIKLILFITS